MSFQQQLKFRALQMVHISRATFFRQLPVGLSNKISSCIREGVRLNTLLYEGVAIDKDLHQRIQIFLTATTNCVASVRNFRTEEYCEIEEILLDLELENQLIMFFIDEIIEDSMFS